MDLTFSVLENAVVRLEPLRPAHGEALGRAADADEIWTYLPFGGPGEAFERYCAWLLEETEAGRWMPFVVVLKDSESGDRVVGMSCYLNIAPGDCRVEIGGTWYVPTVYGTKVNPACKKLLLSHAFACGAERVEFKTDARNTRSRAALRKLGALEEGTLRRHMKLPDGRFRDSVYFSILPEEWPRIAQGLETRLAE